MSHRETSVAFKQGHNRSIPNTKVQSQSVCFNEDAITLQCNQSGVSLSTKVYFFSLEVFNSIITSYALLHIT